MTVLNDFWKLCITGVIFAALLTLSLCGVFAGLPVWGVFLLYLPPYLLIGGEVIGRAFENLIKGQLLDENFLMTAATFAAFGLGLCGSGDFNEAFAVMLFYEIGEYCQDRAAERSRKSVADMMAIAPVTAYVECGGQTTEVSPADVRVGDTLVIRAGDRIPVDGTVLEGASFLDTAALTGESVPRSVTAGDRVLSGCVNGEGVLRVRADAVYTASTVAKTLDLVENAGERKARIDNFITRFARYYTPVVTGCAVLLAFLLPLVTEVSFAEGIRRGCAFLIVSCPCALVLSVPLGFFGGIGACSRKGVLVKGAVTLEQIAKLGVLLFDKTGTLTEGRFSVVKTVPADGETEDSLLSLCAYGESMSAHPTAKAVRDSYPVSVDRSRLSEYRELTGRGISVLLDGKALLLGNGTLMRENGIQPMAAEDGGTLIHVAYDGVYRGYVCAADSVKPQAVSAVGRLRDGGIRRMVMLTGDRRETAERVSTLLGLDGFHAELLPSDKVSLLETYLSEKKNGETVGFVGDGMNDAPVLMQSDVGFAMGALGSDVAAEAADAVIMDDNPEKIAEVMRIAKKTMRIVRENIGFALAAKLAILLLSALGVTSIWLAVFGDVGVSLLCIFNAMRNR